MSSSSYSPDIEMLATSNLPPKELFIRWTELSAYLTSMQFSFVPWQYDQETVDIARDMVRIHEEVVYPLVLEAAEEMIQTGQWFKFDYVVMLNMLFDSKEMDWVGWNAVRCPLQIGQSICVAIEHIMLVSNLT